MNNALLTIQPESAGIGVGSTTGLTTLLIILPITAILLIRASAITTPGLTFTSININSSNVQELELGRVGQKLLNISAQNNELGVTTLNNLVSDMDCEAEHNNLVEDVLSHYHLLEQDFVILNRHIEDINEFYIMYKSNLLTSATNINLWIAEHSPFLYNMYSLLCGIEPSPLFTEYFNVMLDLGQGILLPFGV